MGGHEDSPEKKMTLPTRTKPLGPGAAAPDHIRLREGIATGPIDVPEPVYVTVERAAEITRRNPEVIRRFIRDGLLRAVADPEDGRKLLIPDIDLIQVFRRPHRGYVKREVTLTSVTDGTIIKLDIQKPMKEG
jgi:hypothetical protein